MLLYGTSDYHGPLRQDPRQNEVYSGDVYANLVFTDDHVLRWSHAIDPWIKPEDKAFVPNNASELLSRAATRNRHLGFLTTTDIVVPKFSSFLGASPHDPNVVVIYDLVERVKHSQKLLDFNPKRDNPQVLYQLGDSLKAYFQWLDNTDETLMLYDIFDVAQYRINAAGQAVLMDIEPLVAPIKKLEQEQSVYLDDARNSLHFYGLGRIW